MYYIWFWIGIYCKVFKKKYVLYSSNIMKFIYSHVIYQHQLRHCHLGRYWIIWDHKILMIKQMHEVKWWSYHNNIWIMSPYWNCMVSCDKVTHRHTLKQTHKCANSPEEPKATAMHVIRSTDGSESYQML